MTCAFYSTVAESLCLEVLTVTVPSGGSPVVNKQQVAPCLVRIIIAL
jgi:hypothetical protein